MLVRERLARIGGRSRAGGGDPRGRSAPPVVDGRHAGADLRARRVQMERRQEASDAIGGRIAALPRRPCTLSVEWRGYTTLMEDILSRLTDASHARERGHALFALREIDMFVTTAEFHSAETCADYDAAVAAGRSGQRHLQQAKQRLRRVAAAIQGNALPFDRFGDFQRFYNGVDWYEHASSTDY